MTSAFVNDAVSGTPGAVGSLPPPPSMYPTSRPAGVIASPVPLPTGYTTFLPEAGYPDVAEAANAYMAGQRHAAKAAMSRNAATAPSATPNPVTGLVTPTAPLGAGPRFPVLNPPTPQGG